jgi:hypothetical protein
MGSSIFRYSDRILGYQMTQRADQISRRLKLRPLEVLIAVARSGNMAKAAGQTRHHPAGRIKDDRRLEKTLGSAGSIAIVAVSR